MSVSRQIAATATATALACVALAVAAQPSHALKLKRAFEGPLATQGVLGEQPTIQIKVQFKRRGARLVSHSYANLRHRAMPLVCPDGSTTFLGPFNIHSGRPTGFALPGAPTAGKLKKGKLVARVTGGESVDSGGGGAPSDFLRLASRIPANGPATGTFQIAFTFLSRGGQCNSGPVGFKAPRVANFSPAP